METSVGTELIQKDPRTLSCKNSWTFPCSFVRSLVPLPAHPLSSHLSSIGFFACLIYCWFLMVSLDMTLAKGFLSASGPIIVAMVSLCCQIPHLWERDLMSTHLFHTETYDSGSGVQQASDKNPAPAFINSVTLSKLLNSQNPNFLIVMWV